MVTECFLIFILTPTIFKEGIDTHNVVLIDYHVIFIQIMFDL